MFSTGDVLESISLGRSHKQDDVSDTEVSFT